MGQSIGRAPARAALTSSDINDGIITNAKLADNAVDSAEIVDGSIDTAHIAAAQITAAKVAADVATQAEIDLKAPLASPTFTGTPITTTASAATNTTQVASTAFVRTEVSNLADSAPSTLDTLNELAAALGDDANFSTTVTNSIATKLPLAGGTMTGNIVMGDDTSIGISDSAERIEFDGAGDISVLGASFGVGTDGTLAMGGDVPLLQVGGTTNATGQAGIMRSNAGVQGGILTLAHTRDALGTYSTVLSDDDTTGQIRFAGSDGTDAVSFTASITSSVDGTPGANDMPGRLVLSTSADGSQDPTERMRIDSSGNVGIGTPDNLTGLLEVKTSSSSFSIVSKPWRNTTGDWSGIGFKGGNTTEPVKGGIIFETKGGWGIGDIHFLTNSSATNSTVNASTERRMTITNDGNVGIGTDSPDSTLHLKSSSGTSYFDSPSVGGASNFIFRDSGETWMGQIEFGASASQVVTRNTSSLGLGSNNSQAITIINGGNVGINDTTPKTKLDIAADSVTWNGTWANVAHIGNNAGSQFNDTCVLHLNTKHGATTGGIVGMAFSPGYDNHQNWGIYATGTSGGGNNEGDLHFVSVNNAGSVDSRVTFLPNGNVGIANTAPATKLVIGGINSTNNNMQNAIRWTDSGNNPLGEIKAFRGSNGYDGHLIFSVPNKDDGVMIERMRIRADDSTGGILFAKSRAGLVFQEENAGLLSMADDAVFDTGVSINTACFVSVQSQKNTSGAYGYPSGLFYLHYGETASIILVQHESTFASTDTDGKVCVYNSGNLHIKNRLGTTTGVSVQATAHKGN